MAFVNREEAGRQLAEALRFLHREPDPLILAIPRGGIVVGYQVARTLDLPLDLFLVRKIGAPFNPELALGAVTVMGDVVVDEALVRDLGVRWDYLEQEIARQREALARRATLYRGDRPLPTLEGRTLVLVDDGAATGSTMLAGLQALRQQKPAQLIAALPVASDIAIARLKEAADRVVCLLVPELFWAVGAYYLDFEQVSDEEVIRLLDEAWRRDEVRSSGGPDDNADR
ncbi:MAG TPA: phosphoribosyltransferase [Chloroflexi bacterium]|nr:phosphoribosyltransferase [Chloroflexota bacterium]